MKIGQMLRPFILFMMGLALASCGSREREVDKASAEGILLVGNGTEPKTLDPQLATGVPENKIIQALIEGLVSYHPTDSTQVSPGVAESWESNDDYTVWTFNLRDNARWTNGDPVRAQDFVYSWERILTPALGGEYAQLLYVIKGAEAFHTGQTDQFDSVGVRAIDDKTLEVTLEGPTPFFPNMLQHYAFYPVNPTAVEAGGGMTNRQSGWSTLENYVGNGPFVLSKWDTNQLVEVVPNPDYWDADAVKLKGIRFYPIENAKTEETAYKGGRLHITSTVPSEKIPSLKKSMGDQLRIEPYLGTYFYRINVTRKPFDDVRVRRALNLAIDRKLLTDRVLQGGQIPATGFTPPGIEGFQTADAVGFDPAEAKRLLAEAGYRDGRGFPSTEILINTSEAHRKIAEAIQQMWKENLGIDVGIYNQEWKVYLDSQSKLDYDMSRSGWIADYVHPMTFLEIFTSGNGNNDTGWASDEYDRLIGEARVATTEESRLSLLSQAEAIFMKDVPVIPIYWYTRVYLIDPRVKGWSPTLLDNRPYKGVSLEGAPATNAS